MVDSQFYIITLPLESNLFNEVFHSIDFESVGKGRLGNNLVRVDGQGVPIVRTTTKYTIPAHPFSAIHAMIADAINHTITTRPLADIPVQNYNHALVEVYDSNYVKMNYHSDQGLDLAADSYIGLFSCYAHPDALPEQNVRKLMIKDKRTNEEFEISLTHHSVVLFSLETNARFLHKIVGKSMPNLKPTASDNQWLGITFRKSKTYIQFQENVPHFQDGGLLELANAEQEAEFFKLRGQENNVSNFVYPNLTYTLSVADTMMPKNS